MTRDPPNVSVAAISVGGFHTCAQLTEGTVRCWGNGSSGQLGYGNCIEISSGKETEEPCAIGDDETPASAGSIDLREVQQITAGGAHTCALLMSGSVRCWGAAQSGQLGYGSTEVIGDDETPGSTVSFRQACGCQIARAYPPFTGAGAARQCSGGGSIE
jgi:alpha-tubulin suppressor-like RCC1 family protein